MHSTGHLALVKSKGCRDRMVVEFTTTYAIRAYISPQAFVSSNPAHGDVYSIQHYVTKFGSDLRQGSSFPWISSNKIDHYDITEILLKVALNTITLTLVKSTNRATRVALFTGTSEQLWYVYL